MVSAMLVKWIVCEVAEDQRERFDNAQQAWRRIRYADGLVAQVGGWDVAAPGSACILALWRDDRSYRQFMATLHDAVVEDSGQSRVYPSIRHEVFDVVSRMPGQRPRLHDAFSAGRLLRFADCRVKAGRAGHFVRAQLDVWTPGMASAKGMYGGVFACHGEQQERFVVATAWEDEELHGLYTEHHLPELRARADTEADIDEIERRLVALEPNWTIVGVAGSVGAIG
jgi:heme-degrading monooxygenase HmoA